MKYLQLITARLERIALMFQIRSLEIFLDGQAKALALVVDGKVRSDIQIARANAMLELTRLKAKYRRIKHADGISALKVSA